MPADGELQATARASIELENAARVYVAATSPPRVGVPTREQVYDAIHDAGLSRPKTAAATDAVMALLTAAPQDEHDVEFWGQVKPGWGREPLDDADYDVEYVCEALMEVGGWDEIDGDGDDASIIADHIRRLPHILFDRFVTEAPQSVEVDRLQRRHLEAVARNNDLLARLRAAEAPQPRVLPDRDELLSVLAGLADGSRPGHNACEFCADVMGRARGLLLPLYEIVIEDTEPEPQLCRSCGARHRSDTDNTLCGSFDPVHGDTETSEAGDAVT